MDEWHIRIISFRIGDRLNSSNDKRDFGDLRKNSNMIPHAPRTRSHSVFWAVIFSVIVPPSGHVYNYQIAKAFKLAIFFYSSLLFFLFNVVYFIVLSLINFTLLCLQSITPQVVTNVYQQYFPNASFPPPPLLPTFLSIFTLILHNNYFVVLCGIWMVLLYAYIIYDAYQIACKLSSSRNAEFFYALPSRKKQIADYTIYLSAQIISYLPVTGFEFLSYAIQNSQEEYERSQTIRGTISYMQWLTIFWNVFRTSLFQMGRSYVLSVLFQLVIIVIFLIYLLIYLIVIIMWLLSFIF